MAGKSLSSVAALLGFVLRFTLSGADIIEVLEMHDMAGGLATSWHRGPYTFETSLHWILGSKRGGALHAKWQEVFEIEKLTFIEPEML